mmetsp:Transcript_11234/g.19183  ORF Transcript_11234/g.19183 Transcript_11234/m.19183 type:complete len:407 (+) Transcript_11234:16-1236(+)
MESPGPRFTQNGNSGFIITIVIVILTLGTIASNQFVLADVIEKVQESGILLNSTNGTNCVLTRNLQGLGVIVHLMQPGARDAIDKNRSLCLFTPRSRHGYNLGPVFSDPVGCKKVCSPCKGNYENTAGWSVETRSNFSTGNDTVKCFEEMHQVTRNRFDSDYVDWVESKLINYCKPKNQKSVDLIVHQRWGDIAPKDYNGSAGMDTRVGERSIPWRMLDAVVSAINPSNCVVHAERLTALPSGTSFSKCTLESSSDICASIFDYRTKAFSFVSDGGMSKLMAGLWRASTRLSYNSKTLFVERRKGEELARLKHVRIGDQNHLLFATGDLHSCNLFVNEEFDIDGDPYLGIHTFTNGRVAFVKRRGNSGKVRREDLVQVLVNLYGRRCKVLRLWNDDWDQNITTSAT